MRLKAAGFVLALVATIVATAPNAASSTGYLCDGQLATIVVQESGTVTVGTDGDDVIVGTFGDDEIQGGGGNDTICGHAGNDILIGGAGNDHIQGGNDADQLLGGPGDDVLFGGNGDDEVNGQAGTDITLGEQGDDTLIGDPAVDTLWPGPGDNEIIEATAPPTDAADSESPTDDGSAEAPAFDPDAPLITDRLAFLDAGTFRFDTGGTPFNIEFPEGWEVLFNSEVLGVFGTTDFTPLGGPVNDLLVKRGNALSNPAESGQFLDEQEAPFDVDDLDAWIAATPQEIFTSGPTDTTFGGRDAVTFTVRIEDEAVCGEGPVCIAFTGNITAFDTYSFEPNIDYTVWVVDMGEFDPVFVLLNDNGESAAFSEQAVDVANTIVFDEPQPNPLPLVEAPWEIGGIGEAPPGVVEWPVAGGIAVDIPEASITGLIEPGLFFLTMGTQPIPGELEILAPVSDPSGNPITTVDDFIAAGDVIDFSTTLVGTAETRLGTATVVDIEGGNFDRFAAPDDLTPANIGIITEAGAQFGWQAPPLGRAWIIESERGLIVFTAELFEGERDALDPFIEYAESILPSLRFVDEPDGALPRLFSEVGFELQPAGDYVADFPATNPVLIETAGDAVLLPIGPDLIAVEPPALANPDGPPISPALLDVSEVVTSTAGDTAPVPDDLGAFFENDDRLVIEDSGAFQASGVEARWWQLSSVPGAGLPEDSGCPFGDCVPIFVNSVATGGTVVIGNLFDFRIYEIADPDGTAYAIAQAPPERSAEAFEFAESLLSSAEVLPVPIVPDFEEGDLFGFSEGDTLTPGTYFADDALSVPFTVELAEERRFGIATQGLIGFQSTDFTFSDVFEGLSILEPTTGLAAPEAIGGPEGPPESFIDFPSDLTDWVNSIDGLELVASGSRDIGGVETNFVDIAVAGVPERNGDCGGTPCFSLFEFVFGPYALAEGSQLRIYVVELPATTILVLIEAGEDGFDQFVAEGQSLLDGITFG